MAHSGGIIAAGLGKGRIPWFSRDIKVRHFSVPFFFFFACLLFVNFPVSIWRCKR